MALSQKRNISGRDLLARLLSLQSLCSDTDNTKGLDLVAMMEMIRLISCITLQLKPSKAQAKGTVYRMNNFISSYYE